MTHVRPESKMSLELRINRSGRDHLVHKVKHTLQGDTDFTFGSLVEDLMVHVPDGIESLMIALIIHTDRFGCDGSAERQAFFKDKWYGTVIKELWRANRENEERENAL